MSTIKVLGHKSFEFGGICTWPSLSMWHDLARWLGGVFWKKTKFVVFEIWWFKRPLSVPK